MNYEKLIVLSFTHCFVDLLDFEVVVLVYDAFCFLLVIVYSSDRRQSYETIISIKYGLFHY